MGLIFIVHLVKLMSGFLPAKRDRVKIEYAYEETRLEEQLPTMADAVRRVFQASTPHHIMLDCVADTAEANHGGRHGPLTRPTAAPSQAIEVFPAALSLSSTVTPYHLLFAFIFIFIVRWLTS